MLPQQNTDPQDVTTSSYSSDRSENSITRLNNKYIFFYIVICVDIKMMHCSETAMTAKTRGSKLNAHSHEVISHLCTYCMQQLVRSEQPQHNLHVAALVEKNNNNKKTNYTTCGQNPQEMDIWRMAHSATRSIRE